MADGGDLIARIREIFSVYPRPEHFTKFEHCEECAEHDTTLARHTPDSISLNELGNPGWDPICFATPPAFLYYFPALARLSLGRGEDHYLDLFLFHLNDDRLDLLSPRERAVVRELLQHLWEVFAGDPAVLDMDVEQFERCFRRLDK